MIDVQGLAKSFDDVRAVVDVNFHVGDGELFGFLGPNGAGKTTTINMLTGLAKPDSGTISIGGIDCSKDPKAAQHLMGVVPDESNLYSELTGYDNLCFCGALYGMKKKSREKRAVELLETFGLSEAADRKFSDYSKGMKRKLTIAAGIIHNPSILFLDEPTTGIDVGSARQIRKLIADLNGSGTTIFLTTHYIEEAERLCGRIAFIVSGKVIRVDSVSELMQPVKGKHVMVLSVSGGGAALVRQLEDVFPALEFSRSSVGRIRVESGEEIRAGLLVKFLEYRGIEVSEARKIRASLEDVFVQVTGLEADAMKKEREKKGGGA
jgi:ABC-2 type transport system ATP-binding protein